MDGNIKEETFSGMSARVVLHEYDHMEGIIFTELVPSLILERQKRKIFKNLKLLRKQKEKEEKLSLIKQAISRIVLDEKKKITAEMVNAPDLNMLKK